MTTPLVYDPRYHTFESWASLMVELYAAQQLEIPNVRTNWKEWGNGIKSIGSFSSEAVPDTDQFENWYDWAESLLNAINPAQ